MSITAPAAMIVISAGVGDCRSAIERLPRVKRSETPFGARPGDFRPRDACDGCGIGCRACGSASWHRAVEPSSRPCSDGSLPIVVVVADRPCGALDIAREHGVAAELVERTDFGPTFDRVAYTHDVVDVLRRHDVDLVAIAGFGTILSKPFVDAYGGRAVNTHPALLPSFKGWHAVRDALEFGVKVTGPTVHLVTEDVDSGPILAQEAVPVLDDDTEETLHERIKEVERRLYPDVIERLVKAERMSTRTKIKRALLSVYDKTGLVELAQGPARARASSSCRRATRRPRSRRPASRSRGSKRSPARPRCSTAGSRRCTRRSTAACSPISATRATVAISTCTASGRSSSSCRTSIRSTSGPTSRPSTSAVRR